MCLAIPALVKSIDGQQADVEVGGVGRKVSIMLTPEAKEGDYVHLRLPSSEVRLVHRRCMATIGQVGNTEHGSIKLGKAGRKRWLGRRGHVRGSAMTPEAHPHGGGEGRAPVGMSSPKSPWGQPTLGKKTRKRRDTDKYVVRPRRKKRR